MRIGITAHSYPPHVGGVEIIAQQLARGFARSHEVIVVSTAWQDRTGISMEDGAIVHRLPSWHGSEARGVPYTIPLGPGTRRAMAALRSCDVLHAHGSLYATTLLALLARRRHVPLFVTEHVGFVSYSSTLLSDVQRLAWSSIGDRVVGRSARVVAYNSRVRDWLAARFGNDAVAFITNGVDTVRFHPAGLEERRAARARLGLPPAEVLALFVGRAAQKKNLDAVMEHAASEYRLVVCGADRTLPGHVLNLGALPYAAMSDAFAAADFLLHPAIGEGFPVAVQEAMASGLPVAILWDSGYAGSVDPDALIAAPSLDDLRQAASRLASSPELREEFGRRARDFAVRNWSWDVTVDRYLDLFRTATDGKR
jgi:D-inositol-3-phosphate glycosyltransferase